MFRKQLVIYSLLLLLVPIYGWSQQTYTFDLMLIYESVAVSGGGRIDLTTQLVNSKDNSYYALLERNREGGLELYFEHWETNRYARIALDVRTLKDGDEIRIKKRMLKRLRSGSGKTSNFVLRNASDTLISEKTYKVLSFDPVDPGTKKAKAYNPMKFFLDTEDPEFRTNFWREFSLDTWQSSRLLPNGLITYVTIYDPFGYVFSNTNLKNHRPMSIRLVLE